MAIPTPATPTTVQLILDTGALTDAQITGAINAAAQLILQQGVDDASCHTADSLEQLHIWLSAHFCYLRAQPLSSEKIGDAAESRRNPGSSLEGLKSTYYGQTALTLDCSGLLLRAGRDAPVVAFFGGAYNE